MGGVASAEAELTNPVLQDTTLSDVEVLAFREECLFDQQWLADTYIKGRHPPLFFLWRKALCLISSRAVFLHQRWAREPSSAVTAC